MRSLLSRNVLFLPEPREEKLSCVTQVRIEGNAARGCEDGREDEVIENLSKELMNFIQFIVHSIHILFQILSYIYTLSTY